MVRKEKVNNKFFNIFLYFIILSLEEDQAQSNREGGRRLISVHTKSWTKSSLSLGRG